MGFWPLTRGGDGPRPTAGCSTARRRRAPHTKTHCQADTKLTPHVATWTDKKTQEEKTGTFTNADKPAWNPTLLEITAAALQAGEDPRQWAMYTHQQRFPDDYPDGLKLPHVLHLAELATEYALPHEYKILDDDIEDVVDDGGPGAGSADDTE